MLRPGDIGYVTNLHGVLYSAEHGWDHTFEAYVAGPLAEFARSHNDRERIWIVEKSGIVAGSIAIVEASRDEAQLRWFLVHPELRGHRIGRILMEKQSAFAERVSTLTFFFGLRAHSPRRQGCTSHRAFD